MTDIRQQLISAENLCAQAILARDNKIELRKYVRSAILSLEEVMAETAEPIAVHADDLINGMSPNDLRDALLNAYAGRAVK